MGCGGWGPLAQLKAGELHTDKNDYLDSEYRDSSLVLSCY